MSYRYRDELMDFFRAAHGFDWLIVRASYTGSTICTYVKTPTDADHAMRQLPKLVHEKARTLMERLPQEGPIVLDGYEPRWEPVLGWLAPPEELVDA